MTEQREELRFHAGLLTIDCATVTPDKHKGEVLLVREPETDLPQLLWRERLSSFDTPPEAEISAVLVPGECTLRRLGDRTKRCVELSFPEEPERNVGFWLQQKGDAESDDALIATFNNVIASAQQLSTHAHTPQQAQTEAGPFAPAPAQQSALADALQQALAYAPNAANAPVSSGASEPSLTEVVTSDIARQYLLERDDILPLLSEHLPESQRTKADVDELIRSPQFQSQLDRLSRLLISGEFDLSQFGLNTHRPGAGVINFLEALQLQSRRQQQSENQTNSGDSMHE